MGLLGYPLIALLSFLLMAQWSSPCGAPTGVNMGLPQRPKTKDSDESNESNESKESSRNRLRKRLKDRLRERLGRSRLFAESSDPNTNCGKNGCKFRANISQRGVEVHLEPARQIKAPMGAEISQKAPSLVPNEQDPVHVEQKGVQSKVSQKATTQNGYQGEVPKEGIKSVDNLAEEAPSLFQSKIQSRSLVKPWHPDIETPRLPPWEVHPGTEYGR